MINIALIGLGKMGKNFLQETKKFKNVKILKILKKKKIKKENFYNNSNLFFKKHKLNIDGYIIASPVETHYLYLKKILKINKPIIVEKPLVASYSEFRKLLKLKNFIKKKKILVNHSDLYSSEFNNIKLFLKSIGKINKVDMIFGKHQKNYKKSLPYFDWLPHPIAIFCFLFGKPNKINIEKNKIKKKNNCNFQDLHLSLVRQNIKANINFSNNFKLPRRLVKIIGSKGTIIYNGYGKNKLSILKNDKKKIVYKDSKYTPITNILKKFSKLIENKKNKNDVLLSLNVMERLLKIKKNIE